jgi:opacity protein-like surface antigen
LDYGLGIGAAYEFPMGLFVDARYNLGLANISDDDNYKVNNTGMMVGLGYRF